MREPLVECRERAALADGESKIARIIASQAMLGREVEDQVVIARAGIFQPQVPQLRHGECSITRFQPSATLGH